MSSSHRDDSLLYDYDFDAEGTARGVRKRYTVASREQRWCGLINGVVSEGRGGALGGPR